LEDQSKILDEEVTTLKASLATEARRHGETAGLLLEAQKELRRTTDDAKKLLENNIKLSAQNDEHERNRDVQAAHLEAERDKAVLLSEQAGMLKEQTAKLEKDVGRKDTAVKKLRQELDRMTLMQGGGFASSALLKSSGLAPQAEEEAKKKLARMQVALDKVSTDSFFPFHLRVRLSKRGVLLSDILPRFPAGD
jgi:hypothetical protein